MTGTTGQHAGPVVSPSGHVTHWDLPLLRAFQESVGQHVASPARQQEPRFKEQFLLKKDFWEKKKSLVGDSVILMSLTEAEFK